VKTNAENKAEIKSIQAEFAKSTTIRRNGHIEQRKQEHEDFTEEMSSTAAAKVLLGFAKNRLNKFYNSKLYKFPAASFIKMDENKISIDILEGDVETAVFSPASCL